MKYNICVAIPVKTGDLRENKVIIEKVLKEDPEFIEFRLDYIDDIQHLTQSFLNYILNLVHPNVQSIFTFRDSSEGGKTEINQAERIKLIKILLEAHPKYFDIEMKTERNVLREFIKVANDNNVKLIFSYHDFKKTPPYAEAFDIIKKYKEFLLSNYLIDFQAIKKTIYKLIFTAQKFEDNLIPLKICKEFINFENYKGLISFCMGDLGIFSRVMCVKSGSFLTFGSVEEKTAPGQLNIRNIKELHQLLLENNI